MQQKRSRDQIITQILDLCQGNGVSKTKIVYQGNLNFRSVNPYLDLLLQKGHLDAIQKGRTIYKTTQAGKQALEILLKAEEIYS